LGIGRHSVRLRCNTDVVQNDITRHNIDNLKKHLPFWETVLIANDFVIVINTGYLIPYFKDQTSAYLEKKKLCT
jgi:hypothetical protein